MHLMTSITFKKKKSSPTIDFFYIKSIKKIISSFKTVKKLSAFSVFIIMCPFNFCYLFFFSFISTTMPVFFSDHKPVLGDISTSASVAVLFFSHRTFKRWRTRKQFWSNKCILLQPKDWHELVPGSVVQVQKCLIPVWAISCDRKGWEAKIWHRDYLWSVFINSGLEVWSYVQVQSHYKKKKHILFL